jgi:hypothetical protein
MSIKGTLMYTSPELVSAYNNTSSVQSSLNIFKIDAYSFALCLVYSIIPERFKNQNE